MFAHIPRIRRLTWSFILRADRLLKTTRNIPWRRLSLTQLERTGCWSWPGRMMPGSSTLHQARLMVTLRCFQHLNRMRERSILWDQGRVTRRESGSGRPCVRRTMTSTGSMLELHDSSTAMDPGLERRASTGESSPDSYYKLCEEMTSPYSGTVPRPDHFL